VGTAYNGLLAINEIYGYLTCNDSLKNSTLPITATSRGMITANHSKSKKAVIVSQQGFIFFF
jgi:hypothetical protein